jgi:hypothetical protein
MANVRLSTATRNALANALATQIDAAAGSPNAAFINIYDGSQPASADTAVTSQILLAQLRFADPAFGAAAAGVITANTIVSDDLANATGTAAWARITDGDNKTICDIDVGTSGATLNLVTTSITQNQPVQITSFTFTMPAS